jgi:hypothetical protein
MKLRAKLGKRLPPCRGCDKPTANRGQFCGRCLVRRENVRKAYNMQRVEAMRTEGSPCG